MMLPLTTYEQVESWLLSMTDYERLLGTTTIRYNTRTFDLDHFRDQLRQLQNPHMRYAVIHVAGTKGKGSTCAFIEAALRRCGLKTGLYTSPHLFRFTERVKVNGADISEVDFCRHIEQLRHLMIPGGGETEGSGGDQRSFRTVFEILTAAAFVHFAEQQVDVAIVETGLGGRLDSTNVFHRKGTGPLINVITAIGLDHTAILGETLEAIAGEKAGIIQPHARTVVAPQANPGYEATVADVIRRRCEAIGASAPVFVSEALAISPGNSGRSRQPQSGQPPHQAPGPAYQLKMRAAAPVSGDSSPNDLLSALAEGTAISPSLAGPHQAANAATALITIAELQNALMESSSSLADLLTPACSVSGVENTTWPGRFQVMPGSPAIVIDGAHCAISAKALAATCLQHFGRRHAIIITGFLRDKSGSELLDPMFRQLPVTHAIAVVPPTPRAVTADHICEALYQYLPPDHVSSAVDVAAAIADARARAATCKDAYIVVFGSLYLVGPAIGAAKT